MAIFCPFFVFVVQTMAVPVISRRLQNKKKTHSFQLFLNNLFIAKFHTSVNS